MAQTFEFKPGDTAWFEYHCYEGHDSADAEIWYRSHQQVTVLKIVENGGADTPEERAYVGHPALYKVRFKDGLEWDVFEDELMLSQKYFQRPHPPAKPNTAKSTVPVNGQSIIGAAESVVDTLLQDSEDEEGWIGVDLDGTLAKQTPEKYKPEKIGKPIPKMVARIRRWVGRGKKVKIFTARADDERAVNAIKAWLKKNELPDLEITNLKSPDMIEFWDDRAVAVKRDTGEVKESKIESIITHILKEDEKDDPKAWTGVDLINEQGHRRKSETIVNAAWRLPNGVIIQGKTHPLISAEFEEAHPDLFEKWFTGASGGAEDGFITSTGRFVDRDEAASIAKRSRQPLKPAPKDILQLALHSVQLQNDRAVAVKKNTSKVKESSYGPPQDGRINDPPWSPGDKFEMRFIPRNSNTEAALEAAARSLITAHWDRGLDLVDTARSLAVKYGFEHRQAFEDIIGAAHSLFASGEGHGEELKECVTQIIDFVLNGPLLESPKIKTLKDHQVKLDDTERAEVMKAGAVWHHNGEATPAIRKSVVNGKTWYWCATHRFGQVRSTLAAAIKTFPAVEETS